MKKIERIVSFNNILCTFCLWLYGDRCKVKDHLDDER